MTAPSPNARTAPLPIEGVTVVVVNHQGAAYLPRCLDALEGQEGVFIETRMGFDVDGVEIKARLDFGAKAIDWRGLYKNPGVALS